jgi:acyl carrier protein
MRCARFLLLSKSSIDKPANGGSIGFDQGFGGRMTVGGKPGRREIIVEIVTRLPLRLKLVGELGADENLSSLGLKSFDLVRLMLAVEDAFDLEIPPHLITAESFGSVGAIERLIDTLVG